MGVVSFARENMWFVAAAFLLDCLAARILVTRLASVFYGLLREAAGERHDKSSVYSLCRAFVCSSVREYGKKDRKSGIYLKSVLKVKRAGYAGEFAPVIYLSIKFIVCPLMIVSVFAANYPDILKAVLSGAFVILVAEAVLAAKRKEVTKKLQRHIYKIYKYLHNQISSGVKVQDALRTVYEVIDDEYLKKIFVGLAARYELTLDIDSSLDEFKSSFDAHEAETLCIALRQGFLTGDNQDLLARQEDIMFKKYFNYIQAETDGCKMHCVVVAIIFTSIVVLMIAIPLFNDVSKAVGSIFIN